MQFKPKIVDFQPAHKDDDKDDERYHNSIPMHENVIQNYANIELFHKADVDKKDCIGWITIMEKASDNLRSLLKDNKKNLEERKKIASGFLNGRNYLSDI